MHSSTGVGGLLPFQCSIVDVSRFLLELLEKGCSFPTLKALAISARHIGIDRVLSGAHPLAMRFMKGVHCLKPRTRTPVPSWDLSTVLDTLCCSPREPLESVGIKFLSYNTALLLNH